MNGKKSFNLKQFTFNKVDNKKYNTANKEYYKVYLSDKLIGEKFSNTYGYNSYANKETYDIYCDFSEIQDLTINELPNKVDFNFSDYIDDIVNCEEAQINDVVSFDNVECKENKVFLLFHYKLNFPKLANETNPFLLYGKLKDSFSEIKYFNIKTYNDSEDFIRYIGIDYEVNSEEPLLNIASQVIDKILINLENSIRLDKYNKNNFIATFNFPEQYQSILKPYLLYFEEFLNDLFIETDVNIQKIGEDTILSVEPKNKDEALEKIADALKAYLCAPVIAEGVSVEESLQMQTALTKLYAQCKNLESQMMYKELTLKEQNQQLALTEDIINESKRVLVEAGVDTNIITQKNTMLLESLKSIQINGKETQKKTFLSSFKTSIKVPAIFSGSLELNRKEHKN